MWYRVGFVYVVHFTVCTVLFAYCVDATHYLCRLYTDILRCTLISQLQSHCIIIGILFLQSCLYMLPCNIIFTVPLSCLSFTHMYSCLSSIYFYPSSLQSIYPALQLLFYLFLAFVADHNVIGKHHGPWS